MTTGEVLKEARALVAKGWRQGGYWNATRTCFCPLGAIKYATRTGPLSRISTRYAADEAFARALPFPDIAPWNDAPGRTQADVLAAFDKAIEEVGP